MIKGTITAAGESRTKIPEGTTVIVYGIDADGIAGFFTSEDGDRLDGVLSTTGPTAGVTIHPEAHAK